MTDTYFAADRTNALIELVTLNLRNLNNPDLTPFYSGDNIPQSKFATNLAAAQELMTAVQGGTLSANEFTQQTNGASASLFKSFLNAAGIETLFEDDFAEANAAALVPDLGSRSTYILKNSGTPSLTISDIRDRIRDQVDASSAEHLLEPTLPLLADADPYARARIKNMREYISRYLSV